MPALSRSAQARPRRLHAVVGALLAALVLSAPLQAQATDAARAEKHVVVHIGQYSNDLHSAAMGLSLAGMLKEAGAEVTVFLDREAVRMADTGQPLLQYGDSDTAALMQGFIEAGGRVVVCPHCAELGGVAADALRDGTEMGTKESIAALFLDADTVVDY
jgi:sulfur relay (sulfurtransferase) complex TusBCD TusD component (DsrE family)